jgi:hypothetical protein
MSHAELIRRLESLPPAQQAEVHDFVEFLASRQAPAPAAAAAEQPTTLRQSPLAAWLDKPIVAPGFKPLSREEANERP